jgi:transcriptional accessory protein Tex/SPT6
VIYDHYKYNSIQKRSNFSYAGPRKLDDILKTELLQDKSVTEISDLWMTYHEGKDNVHGIVMEGEKGKSLLAKAAQW